MVWWPAMHRMRSHRHARWLWRAPPLSWGQHPPVQWGMCRGQQASLPEPHVRVGTVAQQRRRHPWRRCGVTRSDAPDRLVRMAHRHLCLQLICRLLGSFCRLPGSFRPYLRVFQGNVSRYRQRHFHVLVLILRRRVVRSGASELDCIHRHGVFSARVGEATCLGALHRVRLNDLDVVHWQRPGPLKSFGEPMDFHLYARTSAHAFPLQQLNLGFAERLFFLVLFFWLGYILLFERNIMLRVATHIKPHTLLLLLLGRFRLRNFQAFR